MPTTLQLRRGNTTQQDAFTGAAGEVTVDTTSNELRVHDGTTAGGHTIGATDLSGHMQVANAVSKTSTTDQSMKATLAVDSEGASSGVHIANGAIEIFTDTGNPAHLDFYCEVSNAHYTRFQAAAHADYSGNVTLTSPTTSGTIGLDADIKDRMQVANTNTLVNDRMQVANTQALHTSVTANLNSYIANTNPRIANILTSVSGTNTAIRSLVTTESGRVDNVLTSISGTNTAIRTLVSDRMQVANTQALHTSVTANLNSYIANTNPRITNILTSVSGTNTAIRTLVSDRMQVANTIALANARLGAAATVALTGDVTASATAFSSNTASISTTIASNSVDGSKLTDNITIAENLVVSGNLTVSGTQTTVNSNEVNIGDAILTLNSDLGSGVAASEDAGITINRGSDTDVSFIYDESEDQWSLGSEQLVSGDLIPNTDSAEDLGTTSVRWRKLYADDADFGNDVTVAGDITVTGTINASVTGTSDSATSLASARSIGLGGDLSGSANFDGSADITINATIQNNSVALGTDTTGNYVGTVTGGTGIQSTGATSGEGIAHTLSLSTAGAGAGTYGSTSNGTKIDNITLDAYGRVTAVTTGTTGSMISWTLEDGDGTEVSVDNNREVKFVEGGGIDINFTDTSPGSDEDPFDLTFTINTGVTAGNGLTGGGTLNATRTISHADTSSQASVNNSGRTYIQDITLDTYGHVTGIASATETVTNTDTNTNQLTTFQLEDGDGTEVTISHAKEVKFVEGGGVDINWTDTSNGSDGDPYDLTFTIASYITAGDGLTGGGQLSSSRTISHSDTSSQASVNNSGRTYIQDITLDGFGHVTGIASATETVVNTDTNTTYSADGNYGMTLSGTAFRLEDDRRRNSTTADIYTGNTHDYVFFDASHGMRFYTSGAEEMRLEDDGDLHVDGNITAYSTTVSDPRLKDDIQPIADALAKIEQLNGYTFTYKHDGSHSAGVVSTEVSGVLPSAVKQSTLPLVTDHDNETEYDIVQYDQLHALTIEAIKTLSAEITALKEEIKTLKGE